MGFADQHQEGPPEKRGEWIETRAVAQGGARGSVRTTRSAECTGWVRGN